MVVANFVPAIGEQFVSVWKRKLNYKGFDLKFFTDKSHFNYDFALQTAFYGITNSRGQNYRDMIGYDKSKTLVGDSIDYNSCIIVRKIGEENFSYIKIGEFTDKFINQKKIVSKYGHELNNNINYEVLTLDKNFKTTWKKIRQVIRHKTTKKALDIFTIGGKNIILTKDHSLMQFKNINELESKECSKLKIKDYIIGYDKLNLPEIDITNIKIPIKYYNEDEIFNFKIDKLSLIFLGCYIGDGSLCKNTVDISGINDKGIKLLVQQYAKKYNVNISYNKNGVDGNINSFKLSQCFKYLGLHKDCYNKTIPNFILNLPKKKIGYFLNGYFSADGGISVRYDKFIQGLDNIDVQTASYKLFQDTCLCLDKLGIDYNVGLCKPGKMFINNKEYKMSKMWRILIYDSNSLRLFKKYVGFTHSNKYKILDNIKIIKKVKLQHSNLPWKIVKGLNRDKNQGGFVAKYLIEHPIRETDICTYRIKRINSEKFTTNYVYDLSVEDTETFLANGILCHNSAGFQIASFAAQNKPCKISPLDSLRWQEENADVAMNLDVPPSLFGATDYKNFMDCLKRSKENFEFFAKNRQNYNMRLYNVLHGDRVELMDIWYKQVKDMPFDGWATGMKPPSDPMIQALGSMFLWEKGEFDKDTTKGLHIFGTSGKHVVPVITYIAHKLNKLVVTYDSSSYNKGSIFRQYSMPLDIGPELVFGENFKFNPQIKTLPCMCPVCNSIKGDEQMLNCTEIYAGVSLSLHNLYQYIQYNNLLNSLVPNKELFMNYLKTINLTERGFKAIEFVDFTMEHGLTEAVKKYHEWLTPQDLNKTQQASIFGF